MPTTIEVKATLQFGLRQLASALDVQAQMMHQMSSECPRFIIFQDRCSTPDASEYDGAIIREIKVQIEKQWERLKADAVAANQAEIDYWSGEVKRALSRKIEPQASE